MIAGLLPIFNNFNMSVLSYYYDKNKKSHYDVKKINNKIICISNNKAESIGTVKKYNVEELNIYYNEYTTSCAEQSIICLLSLSKYFYALIDMLVHLHHQNNSNFFIWLFNINRAVSLT